MLSYSLLKNHAGLMLIGDGHTLEVRIPTKSAMDSELNSATHSDLKPAGDSDLKSATPAGLPRVERDDPLMGFRVSSVGGIGCSRPRDGLQPTAGSAVWRSRLGWPTRSGEAGFRRLSPLSSMR